MHIKRYLINQHFNTMNSKNIQNLIFGTSHVYLMFLFCVGLVHAQRVDVVDHLGNKAKTGTEVEEAATAPTSPKEGDIWIDTSKTPNTTNIWDGNAWKEVKPSYQVVSQDTDTDTKIQLEESTDEDTIRFDTSGVERMVITDEGNVGIGTSSPSEELHLSKSAPGADVSVRIENSASTSGDTATLHFSVTQNSSFDSAFVGSDRTNSLILGSNEEERMRIDQYGSLLVGVTSISDSSSRTYGNAFAGSDSNGNWTSWGSSDGHTHAIFRNGISVVGTITTNSSATSYNTSSDQRLKENIVDAPSASDDIDAIQVRSFDWKTDGSHQKYGMIAQELQTVAPEAVSGDADSEDMMGVDYSKLVPMLIKEIQTLRKRVEQLENN